MSFTLLARRQTSYVSSMIDDLYSGRILWLAANMPRVGRLELPHGEGEQIAKLCGSRANVQVYLNADMQVHDFAQEVKACALGQAAASVIGQAVIGATLQDVREARKAMLDMLKSGGPGPQGRFEGLRVLKIVADYPARHASVMVAIEATVKAVEDAFIQRITGCVLGWSERLEPDEDRTRRAGEA